MSRRSRAVKREVLPDPRFNSLLVTRFVNSLMKRGKRSLAEKIFYGSLEEVKKKSKKNGMDVFLQAVEKIKPQLEVKSRRIGGATYQVPVEVKPERRQALAIRWLILYARQRSERTMTQRLAQEILAAANGEGNAVKKRDDTHKMAEANKAFAHFPTSRPRRTDDDREDDHPDQDDSDENQAEKKPAEVKKTVEPKVETEE